MSERLGEIESQPVEVCEERLQSDTAGENDAQISSRLIWKLCNEGSTVYI